MTHVNKRLLTVGTAVLLTASVFYNQAFSQTPDPANPNATPEARALLKYIQGISGKYILSGQHNFPASGAKN